MQDQRNGFQRRLSSGSDDTSYSQDEFDATFTGSGGGSGGGGGGVSGASPVPGQYANVASVGEVEDARAELARLTELHEANQHRRGRVAIQIKDIQANNRALKSDVMGRLKSSDRVELLELEIRRGMLEVQNMELEHSKMIHQNIIEEKDTLIERLRLQLEVRSFVRAMPRHARRPVSMTIMHACVC